MAEIDAFLNVLLQYSADKLCISTGESPYIIKENKKISVSNTSASQEWIIKVIEEIVPSSLQGKWMPETSFDYQLSTNTFVCNVKQIDGNTSAVFSRKVEESAIIQGEKQGGYVIDKFLRLMVKKNGSDLHMTSGESPIVRVDGDLMKLEGFAPFSTKELERMFFEIMTEKHQKHFQSHNEVDFAYEIEDVARFRCNVYMDRNGIAGAFRFIPNEVVTVEALKLPTAIVNLGYLSKGLVLVTGPTGSGKSTTLCAMIDFVNRVRTDHIITIEDPIEFVHNNKKCLVNQREVGEHTDSFASALRVALREDPDIVMVGEMRDLETIAIALETAETGHLVFGTLHTTTAASTVDRIVDQFPPGQQEQIRVLLADELKAVVSQTLCKKIGGGRVAAMEILLITPAVSNLIREGKTYQIPSIIQTAKGLGMTTLNDSLINLVKKKNIEPREAYIKAVDKKGIEGIMKRENIPMGFLDEIALS